MSKLKGVLKINNKNEILRKNIKKAISNSGIKITWIAKKLGLSYCALWRQLNGSRKLKADIVAEIAILIRKTPNELYGVDNKGE